MNDQELHAEVEREIRTEEIVVGLAQQAFAHANRDEAAARVLYRFYRLAQMNALWTRVSAEAGGDVERARALFGRCRAAQVAADRKLQRSDDHVVRLFYGALTLALAVLTLDYGWKFVLSLLDIHAPDAAFHLVISLLTASVFGFGTYVCWQACKSV